MAKVVFGIVYEIVEPTEPKYPAPLMYQKLRHGPFEIATVKVAD
jgi:hypothetical protein